MKKWISIVLFLACLIPSFVQAGSTATSGITVQDVIDRVRYDINQSSTTNSYISDTMLIKWTDEAVKRIVYKTGCLESAVSYICVHSRDRDYPIVNSYLKVEKVEFDTGVTDEEREPQVYEVNRVPWALLRYGAEKAKDGQNPQNFALWNDTIYIHPMPRDDQSGTTLYVYLITAPSGVSLATNSIETPSYFDPAIYDFVKAKALERDGNEEGAKLYLGRFEATLDEYMRRIQRREILPQK